MNTSSFCPNEKILFNPPDSNVACVYPEEPEIITDNQQPALSPNRPIIKPKFSLKPIYGTVTNVSIMYYRHQPSCIAHYDLTVETSDQQEVHFMLSSNTYFVDCILNLKGVNVVGFYDALAPMLLIYPPQYQIMIFALDLPGRFVKADFFDCYLVSSDNELQLVVSNNTYIVTEEGIPYCGNISNKFMVALYSSERGSSPAITNPNVIIVLN